MISLRSSSATELGKQAAKTLLGHAEESTTEIYLLEEMKVAKALA